MNYISNREQIQIYIGKFWRNFKNTKGWQTFLTSLVIAIVACIVRGKNGYNVDIGRSPEYGEFLQTNFIFTSIAIWIGLFNSITLICKEREIIKHEYRQGMNLSAYISAHMIFQAFVSAIQALIVFGTIFLFYSKGIMDADMYQTPTEVSSIFANDMVRLIVYFITFFLIIFAADAMGLLLSSLVKNIEQAMVITPFVLIVLLVLSGNMELDKFLEPFSLLTISRYGFDSLMRLSGYDKNEIGTAVYILIAWLVLIAFSILFAYLAVRFLKSVENDKRS